MHTEYRKNHIIQQLQTIQQKNNNVCQFAPQHTETLLLHRVSMELELDSQVTKSLFGRMLCISFDFNLIKQGTIG